MRLIRSVLALVCALAMVMIPASTAAAQVSPWQVVDVVESTDEDKIIPVTFPSRALAKQCAYTQSSCPNLQGVAVVDVDVSDEMDGSDGAQFELINDKMAPTSWYVCSFGDEATPTECWSGNDDGTLGHLLRGDLPAGTQELRLMTVQSPVTEYELRVYA